jgi:hypothetical protein
LAGQIQEETRRPAGQVQGAAVAADGEEQQDRREEKEKEKGACLRVFSVGTSSLLRFAYKILKIAD